MRFNSGWIAGAISLACGVSAWAQCANCPPGTRVNEQYTPDNNGAYRYYPNGSDDGAGEHAFAVTVNGERRRIPMGDPTILKIGDVYFVTGTTDACGATNFAIYRSLDLYNWTPHMLAFGEQYLPESTQTYYSSILNGPFDGMEYKGSSYNYLEGVRHREFFSPQLFRDPADANTVYLVFSAEVGPDRVTISGGPAVRPPKTVLISQISTFSFIVGGQSNVFSTPQPIGYDAGSGLKFDGGASLGGNRRVPTSANLATNFSPVTASFCTVPQGNNYGLPTGTAFYGPCEQFPLPTDRGFSSIGRAEWMSIDPFVYFDPMDNNRRWMSYVWFGGRELEFSGNNIAAFPMNSNTSMDHNYTGNTRPMAYRFHQYYSPGIDRCYTGFCPPENLSVYPPNLANCLMLNGLMARTAGRIGPCGFNGVAEAPAAFVSNDQTFFLFSRNEYNSPAYGIFVRRVCGPFYDANLNLPEFRNWSWPEELLVSSWIRNLAGGPSFGSGEAFDGPSAGGVPSRKYLAFHAKQGEVVVNGQHVFPGKYSGRTVYFKELRFASTCTDCQSIGCLLPMYNVPAGDALNGGIQDIDGFLFPTTVCDSIDFNNDGLFPDDEDLADFLRILAGGSCSTGNCNDIDFNNDGVTPDDADLVAFLTVSAGGACP